MLGIHHYALFVMTGILLNLTPGTDTLYIIARSVSQGSKAGIYSSLGIAAGTVVHTLLAAFGLSLLLAKSLVLFTVLKLLGVAYLVYLGVTMLRSKTPALLNASSLPPVRMRSIFVQGVITNVTNPKVALFFLAFLPQFVDAEAHSAVPFMVLGLTFISTGLLWCMTVACFSSFATARLRRSPKLALWLNRITGVVFIALGLKLFRAKLTQ